MPRNWFCTDWQNQQVSNMSSNAQSLKNTKLNNWWQTRIAYSTSNTSWVIASHIFHEHSLNPILNRKVWDLNCYLCHLKKVYLNLLNDLHCNGSHKTLHHYIFLARTYFKHLGQWGRTATPTWGFKEREAEHVIVQNILQSFLVASPISRRAVSCMWPFMVRNRSWGILERKAILQHGKINSCINLKKMSQCIVQDQHTF